MRKSDFIDVCGVPHLIITYGGWVTDCSASEIVLVIPGKPFIYSKAWVWESSVDMEAYHYIFVRNFLFIARLEKCLSCIIVYSLQNNGGLLMEANVYVENGFHSFLFCMFYTWFFR